MQNQVELQQNLTNQIENLKSISAVSLGTFFIIILIMGIFISKSITKPITKLIKSVEKITAGEDVKLESENGTDTQIGELVNAFTLMTNELKQNINEIERQKKQIETILLHMTDGVIAFNMEGKIIHINTAAMNLLKLEQKDNSFEKIFNKLKLNINSNFDFNFLINAMPKNIDTSRIFTKEIKELIISLSFIYDIDAIKMTNIVKGSLNERGTINKETLRKTARNFYQFDNGGNLPTIVSNCQPEYLRKPIGDTSKRAKMIYTFETISPRELLISKNKGNEPTKRDLRLVEDLLLDYNLKPGVVNVLIDYILNINDKKLTRGLVETMAGEWQRKGIETVEDAMSLCEKEHKKRTKKTIEEKRIITKTPDWFDKEIEKEKINDGEDNQLEELLKEYK